MSFARDKLVKQSLSTICVSGVLNVHMWLTSSKCHHIFFIKGNLQMYEHRWQGHVALLGWNNDWNEEGTPHEKWINLIKLLNNLNFMFHYYNVLKCILSWKRMHGTEKIQGWVLWLTNDVTFHPIDLRGNFNKQDIKEIQNTTCPSFTFRSHLK